MALKKVVETSLGIQAEYWKITKIEINFVQKTMLFVLDVFLNKKASDEGCSSFNMARGFLKADCSNEELSGNLRAIGYEFIKANPDDLIKETEDF